MTPSEELLKHFESLWPDLSAECRARVLEFYERVLAENEVQNLTRLTSPKDFFEGHVLDCRELLNCGFLEFPAMDLGSGCGVPGLLCALIRPDSWILVESERMKAEFLRKTAKEMGLSHVRVFADRGETVLAQERVGAVVARAVGPVSRIYTWIRDCSTWNKLVLLKGPKWDDEWSEFQRDKSLSKGLLLDETYAYTVGSDKKKRLIVALRHVSKPLSVPRRT